jgi:hypothetical protein
MIWVVDKTARHVSSAQQSAHGWYAASLTRLMNQASSLEVAAVSRTSHLIACVYSCVSTALPCCRP